MNDLNSIQSLLERSLMETVYRIAGNFRGAKYSWFLWLEG